MSSSIAEQYTERFKDDRPALLALLACSAALQLDDETACEVVKLVANSNGSTRSLVWRVKKLRCVWKEWNGFWHVTEDVRRKLQERLQDELHQSTIIELRELLARKADSRAKETDPHCKVTTHHQLLTRLEGVYQRLLIPTKTETAAHELIELWRQLPSAAAESWACSFDSLSDELNLRLQGLPDAVLFMRGIAAQVRGDHHAQEKYFLKVWRRGRRIQPGYVHAKAAHLLALLVLNRDPKSAEKLLHDSIKWMDARRESGMTHLALGKLIERYPLRLNEAQHAYEKSLELFADPGDQAQAYQALADLHEKKNNAQLQSQMPVAQNAEQSAVVPAPVTTDVEIPLEDFIEPVINEMYQFAEGYLGEQGFSDSGQTSALLNELYTRFFELQESVWENRRQFFCAAARTLRRIFMEHAQYLPTLSLATASGTDRKESFGSQPRDDFLDLDEALNRLQKIDPAQARVVELRFYAGLSREKTAQVLEIPEATVACEWRLAKAFLKREVTRAKGIRKAINLPVSTRDLSAELR
jgi:RNA polymerase sigma-70 factor (ECF subfamily)